MNKKELFEQYADEVMGFLLDEVADTLLGTKKIDLTASLGGAGQSDDSERKKKEDRAKSNMLYLAGQIWRETGEDVWLERCKDNLPSTLWWVSAEEKKEILTTLWGKDVADHYCQLTNAKKQDCENKLKKEFYFSDLMEILINLDDELKIESLSPLTNYIKKLKTDSGFRDSIESQAYVVSAILESYFIYLDFGLTLELFSDYEDVCEYGYQVPYVSLCVKIAEKLESEKDKALYFSELSYIGFQNCKEIVPKWLDWEVRYDYGSFRSKYNLELDKYGKLFIEIHEELKIYESDQAFKWEERFDIIWLQTLYYIINFGIYFSGITEDYIEYTHKYYELAEELDEYFCKNKVYNRKTALYYLGVVYQNMGDYLVAEGYYKKAYELRYLYPNRDVDFFVMSHLSQICLLQNNQEGLYNYVKELYQQRC